MASFPVPDEYKIVRHVQSVRTYVTELDQSNTPIVTLDAVDIQNLSSYKKTRDWAGVHTSTRAPLVFFFLIECLYIQFISTTSIQYCRQIGKKNVQTIHDNYCVASFLHSLDY